MKLVHALITLAFFTASFDILLSANVGGNLRIAQVALFVIMILALARIVQVEAVLWPRGGSALALWTVLQALLLSQSRDPAISFQIYLLLLFTIVGVYAPLQLYGQSTRIEPLMKTYLRSFVFVSFLGAAQFLAPALHLGKPYIIQWIRYPWLPRINVLSYEPSYFATYLIIGWITLIDLRVTGARIVAGKRWLYFVWLMSLVLFLSTSKTAWLFMAVEGLARLAPHVSRLFQQQTRRLLAGSLVVPLPSPRMILASFAAAAALFTGLYSLGKVIDLNIFLSGTGINNQPAHSLTDRVNGAIGTWYIVRDHPWIGRSLGGVPGEIAALRGLPVNNVADLRANWGSPVPLEVYAASGFFAFIPFLWFFLAITVGESRLIRTHWQDDRAKWLHALIRGLLFEWLVLLADQNLLRVYLWFHVTMLVVVGYHLRYSKAYPQPADNLLPA